jgi:hypothetical protein
MKAKNAPFETRNKCPQCGKSTEVIKLGSMPVREICLCPDWDGDTLEK